jgi:4-amino-4-deoxy-L-arabinose transferase-like glycosyltransferase
LLRRHASVVPARIAAFVYALFPYQLFFGRVFMPEIPAQALALVALDSLDRWTIRREWRTLLAAATLTALAILQKLTVAFVALPILYLFWKVYGKRLFARLETYSYVVISAAPSVLWYRHAVAMANESGFAIMQPGLFGRSLGLGCSRDFFSRSVVRWQRRRSRHWVSYLR